MYDRNITLLKHETNKLICDLILSKLCEDALLMYTIYCNKIVRIATVCDRTQKSYTPCQTDNNYNSLTP